MKKIVLLVIVSLGISNIGLAGQDCNPNIKDNYNVVQDGEKVGEATVVAIKANLDCRFLLSLTLKKSIVSGFSKGSHQIILSMKDDYSGEPSGHFQWQEMKLLSTSEKVLTSGYVSATPTPGDLIFDIDTSGDGGGEGGGGVQDSSSLRFDLTKVQ